MIPHDDVRRWALLLLAPLLLLGARAVAAAPAPVELVVSAAASLQGVLEELREAYRAEAPAVRVTFNFGASGALQQQVRQGAPVDVYISAANAPMDALAREDLLLPGTRATWARNALVLVVPRDPATVRTLADLAGPAVRRVALGEPGSVPAGTYAREALRALNLWDAVATRAVYAKDVRQVLAYVSQGAVDAGVVYATDARGAKDIRVVATIPPDSHAPVEYPLAVVRDSRHPDAARRFVAFLRGPVGRAALQRHGFLPPTTP